MFVPCSMVLVTYGCSSSERLSWNKNSNHKQEKKLTIKGKNILERKRNQISSKSRLSLYTPLGKQFYKIIQIFILTLNFLVHGRFLKVLGLKKASKFDIFKKCQTQNLHFWIFFSKIQKWTPNTLFILFWYPTLHKWNFYFSSGCRGVPKI